MNKFFLVQGKGNRGLETKLCSEARELKPLSSETGFRVFELLCRKSAYPSEIAKELKMHEQKVYYYIKQLKQSGLIELTKTEERHGTLAKYYKAAFDSVSLVPDPEKLKGKKEFSSEIGKERELDPETRNFFGPFIKEGQLDAKIVVGCPDPHGEFKARARDGHLAVELSAFLGMISSEIKYPLIFLDTMVKSVASEESNLVIVGGLITNKLTKEINEKLNARFVQSGAHYVIESQATGKLYTEDSMGMIEKIPHPKYRNRSLLVIAGNRGAGTKAAILALVKKTDEAIKPNYFNPNLQSKIVEGLDLDGDGLVDDVEFKE